MAELPLNQDLPDEMPDTTNLSPQEEMVTEVLVPLQPEEFKARDHLMRGRKRLNLTVLIMLVAASCIPLWFLSDREKLHMTKLVLVAVFMAAFIGAGFYFYRRANRLVDQDWQSDAKIVVAGLVVQGQYDRYIRDPEISIDIGGPIIQVTSATLRRAMDDASQMMDLHPGDWMLLELTPYGRVLMRATRVAEPL